MKNEWKRKIIHIDMDAFFASVEQRDHSEYRGKPLIVGGNPSGRGVVSTASYEARKFGVHSAMPAAHARRLCPQGIFIKPSFEKYSKDSALIMSILRKYTELVEPLSLDEAYLDVTQNRFQIEDPVMLASLIKQNIFAVTKLTASAGVAPNLFLAKVASDFKKPDGLTVIRPEDVDLFLKNLPVRKIPGVGPVTEAELIQLGIRTCGQLRMKEPAFLYERFGKTGIFLHQRALGIDEREVETDGERKQYSSEETFAKDTKDVFWLKEKLKDFSREVFAGLKERDRMGRTIILKVKYFDFELITRSRTLNHEPADWQEIHQVACDLLEKKTQAGEKPVRLLGLGISGLKELEKNPPALAQNDLFSGLKALLFIGFVLFQTGCATLFGWDIHAPGILSGNFSQRVQPAQERVALYFDPRLLDFKSTNKGGATADPQTYYVGEALGPMLVEAFQNGFEEFVMMETEPTPQILKRYAIPYLAVVRIKDFENRVTWHGQTVTVVTETNVLDSDLKLLARLESKGTSEAEKIFAKKGGPEVNLNAAIENNTIAIVQYLQDSIRNGKWQ